MFKTHYAQVVMEEKAWQLLQKYLVMMNARLAGRGWQSVNLSRLMGAIITYFLLAHEQEIRDGYAQVLLERLPKEARRVFTREERALLGIPEVVRVSGGGDSPNPPASGAPVLPDAPRARRGFKAATSSQEGEGGVRRAVARKGRRSSAGRTRKSK